SRSDSVSDTNFCVVPDTVLSTVMVRLPSYRNTCPGLYRYSSVTRSSAKAADISAKLNPNAHMHLFIVGLLNRFPFRDNAAMLADLQKCRKTEVVFRVHGSGFRNMGSNSVIGGQ